MDKTLHPTSSFKQARSSFAPATFTFLNFGPEFQLYADYTMFFSFTIILSSNYSNKIYFFYFTFDFIINSKDLFQSTPVF